ncbi:DUF817 domain-containing protein [Methylovirgula sp. 4M-Z18]|uniref:DUF817 domain-containing protein n=1 Tax=Methylovirgula sp. 4M-Z18 TaxID=2293567 RepID=UPI00403F1165
MALGQLREPAADGRRVQSAGFIAALEARAERSAAASAFYEFMRFSILQAWACLFGGAMVALLIATAWFYPKGACLARYDFLTLAAIALQVAMLRWKLETWDEAKVIALFHIVGTAMEIYKTAVGSWIYPEPSLLHIGGVPLFSGFMYASVGSYITRVWRVCDFRFTGHPPLWQVYLLAAGIYLNFFTLRSIGDMRVVLFIAAALIFRRSWIHFRVWRAHRKMPLVTACFCNAFFLWLAENIGTLTRTWTYPSQSVAWSMVGFGKLGSWYLLLIISYAMVTLVNRPIPYAPASRRCKTSMALQPAKI